MHKKTLQFRDKKLLFSCDHHFEKTLKRKEKLKGAGPSYLSQQN